jgi:hypothetical protein
MAGTPLADPIARAFAGVGAFAGPITYTADMMHEGELLHPVFRVGAAPVASMMGMRPVTYDRLSVGYWLRQDAHYQQLLRHALESGAQAGESLLEGWAERIQPPPQELLDLAQVLLPDMLAADLLSMPFSPTYEPPKTAYLPRMPAQLPFVAPSCVRNAMELLTRFADAQEGLGVFGRAYNSTRAHLDALEMALPRCPQPSPFQLGAGELVVPSPFLVPATLAVAGRRRWRRCSRERRATRPRASARARPPNLRHRRRTADARRCIPRTRRPKRLETKPLGYPRPSRRRASR